MAGIYKQIEVEGATEKNSNILECYCVKGHICGVKRICSVEIKLKQSK